MMKKIIAAFAFLAFSLPTVAQQEYLSGYLTVERFKSLPENEQRLVVIAAREATVFTLHNVEIHWLDQCISQLSDEDVQLIVNSVVSVEGEELQGSFVGAFVFLSGQVCIATQQQLEQQQPQQPQGPRLQMI